MVVQCVACKRDMKAGEYDENHCKQETAEEPIEMARVIHNLTSESSIAIPTGGTVSILTYNIYV